MTQASEAEARLAMATTKQTITYGETAGEALAADLYRPEAATRAPIIICMHGGGWRGGARRTYQYLGPMLAGLGYVVLSIDYRLVPKHPYPAAVDDVRTAIAFAKAHAAEWNADADAIALMGDSAGAHLAALTGLSQASDIKAIMPVYGVYDLAAQWEYDLGQRPNELITQDFIGTPLYDNRRAYFEASPLSYVTRANNHVAVFLAWGTEDDIVLPSQAERFLVALKQAAFYVRTVIQTAPHFWLAEPLDEPGSLSGFYAKRLVRFLAEKLPVPA